MENLHTSPRKNVSGSRILRLMTITSDEGEQQRGSRVSTKELMNQFVIGDGLIDGEQLIINGQDALETLPRPEAFGNNRLALMAILDTMPPDAEMMLEIDEVNLQVPAAD